MDNTEMLAEFQRQAEQTSRRVVESVMGLPSPPAVGPSDYILISSMVEYHIFRLLVQNYIEAMDPTTNKEKRPDDVPGFEQTRDAKAWARAFCHRFGGDEGLMTGWFANALERGWSEGVSAKGSGIRAEANIVFLQLEDELEKWYLSDKQLNKGSLNVNRLQEIVRSYRDDFKKKL